MVVKSALLRIMYKSVTVSLIDFLPRKIGLLNAVKHQSKVKFHLRREADGIASNQHETDKKNTTNEKSNTVNKNSTAVKKDTQDKINISKLKSYIEQTNPKILKICPDKCLKLSTVATDMFYLINPETAKEVTSLIINDLSQNMNYVIHINPGMGLLTKELLEAGVPSIDMYEGNECFYQTLKNLMEEYPGRLSLKESSFTKDLKLMDYHITRDDTSLQSTAVKIQKKWEEKTYIQIIGSFTEHNFMKYIVTSLLFQNTFMSFGRPMFYLMISPSMWNSLTCTDKRRSSRAALFQIFFNYCLLGTVSRQSFVPWQRKVHVKRRQRKRVWQEDDHSYVCVVKFEPKPDLFSKYLSKDDLVPFWHFLRHNLSTLQKKVIPELEKWAPGCGVKLIAKNYTIFTEFQDLTCEDLLDLYRDLRLDPNFVEMAFYPPEFVLSAKMKEYILLDLGRGYDIDEE